ncbi:hypothetical protein F8388_005812 [Cannabis sativa]|uniref:DUF4283 domain-containing protein n=1 Tax=Cannabis sativa TaxID=3483 RepID=A0A7J6HHJ5_CANSA|nr:hypothetical protein F8388_005812 [Cannabis sativa]
MVEVGFDRGGRMDYESSTSFGATKLSGKFSPFMGRVQSMISGDDFLDLDSNSLVFFGLGCEFMGWWVLPGRGAVDRSCCVLPGFWCSHRVLPGSWCDFPSCSAIVFSLIFPMDLELVNRLAEVLVLDEGDGPVLALNQAGVEEGKKRMDLCLVGKVIGPKPVNKDGIERAMKGIWRINNRFQVEELSSKNVFRYFFGSREERQQVYGGGPWTIDK